MSSSIAKNYISCNSLFDFRVISFDPNKASFFGMLQIKSMSMATSSLCRRPCPLFTRSRRERGPRGRARCRRRSRRCCRRGSGVAMTRPLLIPLKIPAAFQRGVNSGRKVVRIVTWTNAEDNWRQNAELAPLGWHPRRKF